jgi:hypothetical protein
MPRSSLEGCSTAVHQQFPRTFLLRVNELQPEGIGPGLGGEGGTHGLEAAGKSELVRLHILANIADNEGSVQGNLYVCRRSLTLLWSP